MDNIQTDTIPPMLPGIFTLPPYGTNSPFLLGGYCARCEEYFFPRPGYCPRCLGSPETRKLGNRGRIHSFTVVRTKPPLGLPQPYAVGYVDLEEGSAGAGLRVFSLFDPESIDDLQMGGQVTLQVSPLGHDGKGEACLRPYFKPLGKTEEERPWRKRR